MCSEDCADKLLTGVAGLEPATPGFGVLWAPLLIVPLSTYPLAISSIYPVTEIASACRHHLRWRLWVQTGTR